MSRKFTHSLGPFGRIWWELVWCDGGIKFYLKWTRQLIWIPRLANIATASFRRIDQMNNKPPSLLLKLRFYIRGMWCANAGFISCSKFMKEHQSSWVYFIALTLYIRTDRCMERSTCHIRIRLLAFASGHIEAPQCMLTSFSIICRICIPNTAYMRS